MTNSTGSDATVPDPTAPEPTVPDPTVPDASAADASAAGRAPLLEMRGVSKAFPGVKALDDVQLRLGYGETLALVGENGAGKSTLMKLLAGIYTPDAGEIVLGGEPVTIHGPAHAQQLGISIIHQEFNLMQDLTVAQNIYIGREPSRFGVLDERRLNRDAQELFDRLGIVLDPRQLVSELSVARQQMVEIAKALSHESRVLIMDEPTAALNEQEVDTLHALIRRFVTDETGVIYISHRMDELRRISDHITVLRDGQYVDTRDTATTSLSEVISLMVGREIDTERRPEPAEFGPVVLKVEQLSTKHLLKDVAFELRRGEILGFAGLMGAGRTEVARAIIGADPVTSKHVEVHGEAWPLRSPADAAAKGIGYLSEDRKRYGVLVENSVRDNIAIASLDVLSRFGFVRDREIGRISEEYVDRLRIKTPSTKQLVKNLSGGNQQKVALAKWLEKDCDILIIDEPTRGIDVGAKDEIYRLLTELAKSGKAIMMISSELPEVLRLSHRIVVMCEGSITAILDNAEADQETIMDHATRLHDTTVIA